MIRDGRIVGAVPQPTRQPSPALTQAVKVIEAAVARVKAAAQ